MGPAGNPADALLFGLLEQGPFKLPPGLLQTEFMGLEEWCFLPCPTQEGGGLPSPFLQVSDGSCHGSSDSVPWMVLCLELVIGGRPCLFKGWELVLWPCLQELVDGTEGWVCKL